MIVAEPENGLSGPVSSEPITGKGMLPAPEPPPTLGKVFNPAAFKLGRSVGLLCKPFRSWTTRLSSLVIVGAGISYSTPGLKPQRQSF
jgi:hypothetical protein